MSVEPLSATDQVYHQVLRYIRGHKLAAGDQLPAQTNWLRELGCGTVSFNSAMRKLESEGVLHRRRRVGTRLLRTAPGEKVPWTIAICGSLVSDRRGGLAMAVLTQYIHGLLQEAGCQVRIYSSVVPYRLHHELTEYGAFNDDLERGRIDGAVFTARLMTCDRERLAQDGVVECGIYSACSADVSEDSGLMIDQAPMIRRAVDLLAGQGRQRIALVMPGMPWVPEKPYFEQTFRKALANHPQSIGLEWMIRGHVRGGMDLGERLLRLPLDQRPDALICTQDDYVTLGVAHAIRRDPAYRPAIVTLASRELPMPFPLPVYRFELDLMEIARKSVQFLLNGLHTPGITRPLVRLAPQLNETEPSEIPHFLIDRDRNVARRSASAGLRRDNIRKALIEKAFSIHPEERTCEMVAVHKDF